MLSDVQDSASLCTAPRDWKDLMKSVIVEIYKVFARFWDLWETSVKLRTMKSVSQWQVAHCVSSWQTMSAWHKMSLWHKLHKCHCDTDFGWTCHADILHKNVSMTRIWWCHCDMDHWGECHADILAICVSVTTLTGAPSPLIACHCYESFFNSSIRDSLVPLGPVAPQSCLQRHLPLLQCTRFT